MGVFSPASARRSSTGRGCRCAARAADEWLKHVAVALRVHALLWKVWILQARG